MIYKASLYKKELRRSQLECFTKSASLPVISVYLAAVSIAVHRILTLLPKNAFFAYLPPLLRPDSLPFFYSYNLTAFIFFFIVFTYRLGKAPFSGLGENKWYLISKMGYNVKLICVIKVLSFLLLELFSYALGLAFGFIAVTLLNLNFNTAFLLPALMMGALQMLLLALFASFASLFSDTKGEARAFLFTAVLLVELMKLFLGYYRVLGDAGLAGNVTALFIPQYSFYGIFAAVAALILLVIALRAAIISTEYYSLKNPSGGFTIVRYLDGETVRVCEDTPLPLPSYAAVINFIMAIVIFLSLILNTIFILDSLGIASKLSFTGFVPLVFDNSRMEPEIGKSDFVVIRIVGSQYSLQAGDKVFIWGSFDGSEFTAMSVLSVKDESVELDYLNYPLSNIQNSLKKTVNRGKIYGVLCFKSRALGILILFSSTPEGRILTIALPLALLLFSRRIFARRRKQSF